VPDDSTGRKWLTCASVLATLRRWPATGSTQRTDDRQTGVMTDDPFLSGHRPPPRVPRPGELLFEFIRGTDGASRSMADERGIAKKESGDEESVALLPSRPRSLRFRRRFPSGIQRRAKSWAIPGQSLRLIDGWPTRLRRLSN